ncbi:MAG TPA: hypothetical protein PKO36_08330, partial [Candidatus Hydrogenedentes bacterium]|nr:hypothetical protein [Candidatus Hydrogenedentota bacterium]
GTAATLGGVLLTTRSQPETHLAGVETAVPETARDLYLRGSFLWTRRTPGTIAEAMGVTPPNWSGLSPKVCGRNNSRNNPPVTMIFKLPLIIRRIVPRYSLQGAWILDHKRAHGVPTLFRMVDRCNRRQNTIAAGI